MTSRPELFYVVAPAQECDDDLKGARGRERYVCSVDYFTPLETISELIDEAGGHAAAKAIVVVITTPQPHEPLLGSILQWLTTGTCPIKRGLVVDRRATVGRNPYANDIATVIMRVYDKPVVSLAHVEGDVPISVRGVARELLRLAKVTLS
jgi:hypothetical protein